MRFDALRGGIWLDVVSQRVFRASRQRPVAHVCCDHLLVICVVAGWGSQRSLATKSPLEVFGAVLRLKGISRQLWLRWHGDASVKAV